jgi:hypothetical protein
VRRVLSLALSLLDATWLYPWSLLFGAWLAGGSISPLLPFLVVFGLLFAARTASRLVRRLRGASQRLARAAVVFAGCALAIGFGLTRYVPYADPTPAIVLGGFALWLWWRGLGQGRGTADFEAIEGTFRRGVVALLVFVGVAAATVPDVGGLEAAAGPSVVSFFAIGLATLGLARLASVRETSRARAGAAPTLNRQWLGTMLGVVGAVVLGALALDALLSFGLIAAVFRPFLDALGFVLFYLILVIAIPIGLLAQLLVDLLRGRLPPLTMLAGLGQFFQALEEIRRGREPVQLSDEVQAVAQWLAIGLVALAIVVALYRAISWWREREAEEDVEEERDSLWRWEELWPGVLAFLRGLLGRKPPAPAPAAISPTPAEPIPPGLADVRAIYRALLALGQARGAPRMPATTPHEHLPDLTDHLAPPDDVAAITDAYADARYGERPPREDLEALRTRLTRVGPLNPDPPPDQPGTPPPRRSPRPAR